MCIVIFSSNNHVPNCIDCGFKGPLIEQFHRLSFTDSTKSEVDDVDNSYDSSSSFTKKTRQSNLYSSPSGNEPPTFASPGKYRWMGYLTTFRERKPLCSCSLINNLYVLTAVRIIALLCILFFASVNMHAGRMQIE